ncbi:hypothetical protein FGADI_8140 [Fusarium gaditjirri]|uniref:Uncharacterized protein n=1 Tax=Fusarium gaditjirri TaxID=282569 RepID=A0A8H4WUN7_9HYPO|nr:hypothetical protein FGADI_8140 [Fusarium gaditjirri]
MSDTQNNKRRASDRPEDEPPKKRGRPSKAALTSKVPENSVSRVQAHQMLIRHDPLDYSSQGESSFYDELVPWPKKFEWRDEDNDVIDEEWEKSEIKEMSERLNTSQYAQLFLLFKICLRLYRTTPIALLSPICALRYQVVSKNSLSNEWIMSGTFCEKLSSIMVHPCWKENIDSLALALRWTVICRLDSRSPWAASVKFSCPVIQRVQDRIISYGDRPLEISYHEMHKAERERASDRGESLSTLSEILFEVGEAVPKCNKVKPNAEPKYNHIFGWSVLPVTVWDLRVLAQVVDSMEFKPEWNYSVEDALNAWKAENSGPELPPQDKLSLIYAISHKSVFRHLRLVARQITSVQGTDTDDDQSQSSNPLSPSGDNESQQNASSPDHQSRRQTAVGESSDEESEASSNPTGRRQRLRRRHVVTDSDSEDSAPVGPEELDFTFEPAPVSGGEEVDDKIAETFDAGVNFDSDEFSPQATQESDGWRPRGPTLSESLPLGRPASPIYASLRESQMLAELSELRKENKSLRDGQKKLQDLFDKGVKQQNEVIAKSIKEQNVLMLQGQKEQMELMVKMQEQLKSMQSELSEFRQAKEASSRGDNVQRHPERPRLPEVPVTVSNVAPESPELGTNPLAPQNDVALLEEVTGVDPMDEDIPPEQAEPRQATPEPESPEQPVTAAPEALPSTPEQNTRKQKMPEPETSMQRVETVQEHHDEPVSTNPEPLEEGEDRTHAGPQLPDSSRQTLVPSTSAKVSSQSLIKGSLPGLAERPIRKERRIRSMRGLVSSGTPISSVQRSIFQTPKSELLKMWKKIE